MCMRACREGAWASKGERAREDMLGDAKLCLDVGEGMLSAGFLVLKAARVLRAPVRTDMRDVRI